MSIDLGALAQAIVGALIAGMQALFAPLPQQFEQTILSGVQHILSSENGINLLTQNPTDWITRDNDVLNLYHQGTLVMISIALIVATIQGIRIMNHKIDMYEGIGRVLFFCILGDGMLTLSDKLLTVINDLSAAVAGNIPDLAAESLPTGPELFVLLIIGAFFAVLAWIKGAVGVVFLKVLIVVAPYFLPLSALPTFAGLGTWWAEEMTTWMLRPFMVALALRLGLGIAAREGGPIGLIFTLVAFWLAWTMDSRIRRFSVGAWGGLGQLGLFARGARLVAGALSGGTAAAASAAT